MLRRKSRIVCIFAHPDDEAFGPSGTIAKYADGGEVYIICVTDGYSNGTPTKNLSQIRKGELQKSAKVLGVKKVYFLKFKDGELCNNIYHLVAEKIEKLLRKIKPDILLTFELRGVSGHLDHTLCSSVTSYLFRKLSFTKTLLYYCVSEKISERMKDYFIYFPQGFKKGEVDLVVDVSKYWNKKLGAINVHQSQAHDIKTVLSLLKHTAKEEYFLVQKK